MVKVRKNLIGQEFGRLKVIKQAEDYISPTGRRCVQWECQCSCEDKTILIVRGSGLQSKKTQSCGCLQRERASKAQKEYNRYDLSGEFGIGWTNNTNKEFYFDLNDYDLIKDYCWSEYITHRYHMLCTHDFRNNKKNTRMSGILGCKDYDHIDRNPLNNRRCNLRPATKSDNAHNKSMQHNNTSGVIGVHWTNNEKKWRAQIVVNNQQISLGYHKDKDDAIRARLIAEIKYFGEFAPQKHLFEEYGVENTIRSDKNGDD